MKNTKQQVTSIQTTLEESVTHSSKLNQKGFIPVILGVIVIFITVAGVVYYLETQKNKLNTQPAPFSVTSSQTSPTPSSTANSIKATLDITGWKTYSNGNFSFKYPSNWEAIQTNIDEGYIDFFEVGKPHVYPGQSNGGNQTMTILVNKHDADLLWKNLHDTVQYPEYATFRETTIAGKRAMMKPAVAIIWYGPNDKIRLEINTDNQYLQTTLSTFKFIN